MAAYTAQSILISLPQILLIVYILWLQRDWENAVPLSAFGLVRLRTRDLLYGLVVYLGIFALLIPLSYLLALLPTRLQDLLEEGYRWKLSNPALIPLVIVFSIVVGYREELFFRAYLLTRFHELALSPAVGLALSCLLFAAGHLYQGLAGLIVALVQGIYFGLIFIKTGNLHSIALAHGLYNLTVLLLTLFTDSLPIGLAMIMF
jgi:hypothetical protein